MNDALAVLARQHVDRHAARTPGRRAAAALWVALTDTKTPAAARRALEFADPATRAAAIALLRDLEAAPHE